MKIIVFYGSKQEVTKYITVAYFEDSLAVYKDSGTVSDLTHLATVALRYGTGDFILVPCCVLYNNDSYILTDQSCEVLQSYSINTITFDTFDDTLFVADVSPKFYKMFSWIKGDTYFLCHVMRNDIDVISLRHDTNCASLYRFICFNNIDTAVVINEIIILDSLLPSNTHIVIDGLQQSIRLLRQIIHTDNISLRGDENRNIKFGEDISLNLNNFKVVDPNSNNANDFDYIETRRIIFWTSIQLILEYAGKGSRVRQRCIPELESILLSLDFTSYFEDE